MSWGRTSNFTVMPNRTVCSSALGRRKRTLSFCIPGSVRNLLRVVPYKVLTLQLVKSKGGGQTRPKSGGLAECDFQQRQLLEHRHGREGRHSDLQRWRRAD